MTEQLFEGGTIGRIDVSVVFPSHRELSPTVRAFVDFMRDASVPGILWLEA